MSGDMMERFERRERGGWGVNMHVVTLDDGVLVYSPSWVGGDTFERVEALGTPRVLVAPNHYHHLAIPRFRERYPDAMVVAGERARPRLERKGHQGVLPLEAARELLPAGLSLMACPGCKTGESWLCDERDGGRRWVVGDAFFNVLGPLTGLLGWGLRLAQIGPGLQLGKTFRWLAVDDRSAYRGWVRKRLEQSPPQWVGFSHGDPVEGDDVAAALGELVEERLAG